MHYLRCTPPTGLGLADSGPAEEFDKGVFGGLEFVLGRLGGETGLTQGQRDWAGLPLALGGLGLTPATVVERYAWLASYHDTQRLQEAVLHGRDTPQSPSSTV